MSEQRTCVVRLSNGEIVIGRTALEAYEQEGGSIQLTYPISINVVPTQAPDGTVQQQMSVNPYFPFADYDAKEGVNFPANEIVHCLAAVEGLAQVHQNYITKLTAESNGLVVAGANDLPENQFAVNASEMTGGDGLRITED